MAAGFVAWTESWSHSGTSLQVLLAAPNAGTLLLQVPHLAFSSSRYTLVGIETVLQINEQLDERDSEIRYFSVQEAWAGLCGIDYRPACCPSRPQCWNTGATW